MKKISKIFSFMFLLASLFLLAACSKGSGIKGELSFVARRTELEITADFEKNEKLEEESTSVSLKLYSSDEAYKTAKALKIENGITAKETFTNLEANTEYIVKLFVSYEGEEEEIASIEAKTTATGSTEDTAVIVKTVEDFKNIKTDAEGYYKLDADLDFKEEEISLFTKINDGFKGTFDGNGHTLSNIKLGVSETVGVFGALDGATIKNLKINIATLAPSTTVKYAGAVAGYVKNSTIENVEVVEFVVDGKTAAQASDSYIGGLVGLTVTENNKENVIKNCKVKNSSITFTELKVSSTPRTHSTGLFAGSFEDMTSVENCTAEGLIDITLSSQGIVNIAGFVGSNLSAKAIKSCVSDADVTITRSANTAHTLYVGGFIGSNTAGYCNVEDSLAIADINVFANTDASTTSQTKLAKKAYIGGFMGAFLNRSNNGIKNCAYQPKEDGIVIKAMPTGTLEFDDDKNVTGTTYDIFVANTFAKIDSSLESKVQNVNATEDKIIFDVVKASLDDGDSKTVDTTDDATKLAEVKAAIINTSNVDANAKDVLSDNVKNYSSN